MIIKPSRGRSQDIEALQALLQRPALPAPTRTAIEREIRNIRAGEAGEREAAYEIDFHHGSSRNWAVIHDLRIEHEGRVAQIDHLLVGRFLDVWVCETKHFAQGVAINDQGEFTRFYQGRASAIPSPIEQNRKHLRVLESILSSDKVMLPKRLGIALKPKLHSVILVSQKARITRPKALLDGFDMIVKSDQLRTLIEREIDEESVLSTIRTMGKLVGSETLHEFASQVARLHRPLLRDWAATFAGRLEPCEVPVPARDHRLAASPQTKSPTASAISPAQGEPNQLTTSKLGAAMGLPNVEATLKRLAESGLIELVDGKHVLTEAGIQAGGQFVPKGRFGPYFLWPKALRL